MKQNEKLIKTLENMAPIDLDDIPKYYKGKNGYMAKDVVSNFDLSYNIGTAVTYLLRSKNKHNDKGVEDIRKAINHLHFELDRLYDEV
jgi:hypothetical protein